MAALNVVFVGHVVEPLFESGTINLTVAAGHPCKNSLQAHSAE